MDTEKTQNSILRISDENTLRLVELYSQEECLWNTHLDEYKNKVKRVEAAERIAKALNIKHFEAKHVMIKFKNLRNSYCQELKKIAHSLSNAAGDDAVDVYKPRVFWFSTVDSFLRPHLQARGSRCAGTTSSETAQQDDYIKKEPGIEDVEEWIQMSNPEAVEPADSIQYTDNSCSDHDNQNEGTPYREQSASPRPAKRPRLEEDFEQKLMYHTIKDISSQMQMFLTKSNDHFERFGSYIASLLRTLPPQKALMLQPKIVSLIASTISEGNDLRVTQSDI